MAISATDFLKKYGYDQEDDNKESSHSLEEHPDQVDDEEK